MSLDTTLSPRAIAGFARRYERKLAAKRLRAARDIDHNQRYIIERIAAAGRFRQIGNKFGDPKRPDATRITITTARHLYHAGLVCFVGTLDGMFLELTPLGLHRATVLKGL